MTTRVRREIWREMGLLDRVMGVVATIAGRPGNQAQQMVGQ